MPTLTPSSSRRFYLNGKSLPLSNDVFIGARLLREFDPRARIPGKDEPPYLFCGNGACRDCNLSIDGLPELPSCRLPLAAGLSVSGSGEGALPSRIVAPAGEAILCDVLVVGAGPAGAAAASGARCHGAVVVQMDARCLDREEVRSPCPVAVEDERLVGFENGCQRPVEAGAVVLATGWHDAFPTFPGSTRPGVLPMDLLARYLAHGFLPGGSVLLVGSNARESALRGELLRLGAERVETAPAPTRVDDYEIVALEGRRQPSLSLAKALGCRTTYDRKLRFDRLDVGPEGRTSVPNLFAAGRAFGTDGNEVGRAAARCARRARVGPR